MTFPEELLLLALLFAALWFCSRTNAKNITRRKEDDDEPPPTFI